MCVLLAPSQNIQDVYVDILPSGSGVVVSTQFIWPLDQSQADFSCPSSHNIKLRCLHDKNYVHLEGDIVFEAEHLSHQSELWDGSTQRPLLAVGNVYWRETETERVSKA